MSKFDELGKMVGEEISEHMKELTDDAAKQVQDIEDAALKSLFEECTDCQAGGSNEGGATEMKRLRSPYRRKRVNVKTIRNRAKMKAASQKKNRK